MQRTRVGRHLRGISNEGSAFVISILILFVLSVLGMALMLTTTTEKDIAINYRWGEQAFFNADAALEYGKNVLGSYLLRDGDFKDVLPPARNDVTVVDSSAPLGTRIRSRGLLAIPPAPAAATTSTSSTIAHPAPPAPACACTSGGSSSGRTGRPRSTTFAIPEASSPETSTVTAPPISRAR